MLDYLIVGSGLAGMAVGRKLERLGRSVMVFDHSARSASQVAAGLYNPVVLKRLNLTWRGAELMRHSLPFYRELQEELEVQADHPLPILRLLHAPSEQNAWVEASDRPELSGFLESKPLPNDNPHLRAPYGFGRVVGAGWLNTSLLLNTWSDRLASRGCLKRERFDPRALIYTGAFWEYAGLRTKRVIFCEGFNMLQNPFFKYLPLQGTKGEYLTIHAPELDEERIIKSSVFLIPLGGHRYRVGATYAWNDFDPEPTQSGREQLLSKLGKFLQAPFTIEGQTAGIRPTVPDRRPLVGRHPEAENLFVLNGLGSRGVLLAPFAAERLIALAEEGRQLPEAMDIARYAKRYTTTD